MFRWIFLFLILFMGGWGCSHQSESIIKPDGKLVVTSASGQKYFTGLKVPVGFKPKIVRSALDGLKADLPAEFDARVKGYKSPESQGNCGSCWAFSMSATIQDSYKYQTGKDFDTSEQHVLSCTKPGEYSCNGGFFDYNRHMTPFGGVTGASWPYSGTDEACKSGLNHQIKIKQWAYLPGGENPPISEIKAAIYRYGIVSVGVAATDGMSNYRGGIWAGDGSTSLNHAVALVGWSDAGQYWVMKNSWGNWGEQGYMRIKYGANGIGTWANYVVFEDNPTPDPNPNPDPTPNPTPDPDPTPPPPPPECEPKPYADTGYGDQIKVRVGATVMLGTKARPGHYYYWTAEPAFENGATPKEAKIKYSPRITKRLTVHAVTQCGEAIDSVTVNAMKSYNLQMVPEVQY
jgi:hypothetical protein